MPHFPAALPHRQLLLVAALAIALSACSAVPRDASPRITPLIEASCPSPLLLESLAVGARTDEAALQMRIALLEGLYGRCRDAVFQPRRATSPVLLP